MADDGRWSVGPEEGALEDESDGSEASDATGSEDIHIFRIEIPNFL